MITFYDIPSTLPQTSWSPNTRKTRYSLNFKGIPYETVWVEYPDIETVCKKIGASSTIKRPDGRPLYTLPVIRDSSTGAVVAESGLIAEYLDATYPNTPKLFPPGTKALQCGFLAAHQGTMRSIFVFTMPATLDILNQASKAYFRETKFGPTLKEIPPRGKEWEKQWAVVKAGFDHLEGRLQKEGPFVMGDTICFADLVIASYILWIKSVLGEESVEWKDVKGWHGGRWDVLLKNLEKYEKGA